MHSRAIGTIGGLGPSAIVDNLGQSGIIHDEVTVDKEKHVKESVEDEEDKEKDKRVTVENEEEDEEGIRGPEMLDLRAKREAELLEKYGIYTHADFSDDSFTRVERDGEFDSEDTSNGSNINENEMYESDIILHDIFGPSLGKNHAPGNAEDYRAQDSKI